MTNPATITALETTTPSNAAVAAPGTPVNAAANGNKNLAQDSMALCALYRQHWAAVSEVTTLSEAELDQAQAVIESLSFAVGIREQQPETAAQAVRDRQAAFTLFINTYDEITAAVGYVRRKYGDADVIAPSLYLGRASKKKPSDETDAKVQTAATGGPSAATTSEAQSTSPGTHAAQGAKAADVSDKGPFVH